jgi:protoporphyrinogen oxidase
MKVCIIGGGVAGLYLGTRLTDLGHSVDIYEKTDSLGGRICTQHQVIRNDTVTYEAGAGRFNKTHKRLMKLLKKLELQRNIKPINPERSFQVNSRHYDYDKIILDTLFKNILKITESTNYNKDYMKSVTLKDYMNQVVGKQKTQRIIDAFGYNSEFELQNAYTSLEIFKNDFNDNIQYYYLQGGLSQIINILHQKLVKNQKNNVYINTEVIDYDNETNTIRVLNKTDDNIFTKQYDKVVFCVTKQSLLQFVKFLTNDKKLHSYLNNSIEMSPLHRIFAKFPRMKDSNNNDVVWFNDIKRTTTNLPIRYIIPINIQSGLLQISYTDKQFADYWNTFVNEEELIDELMKNLKILFPKKDIPRPIWIKKHYWNEGATYWKPSYKLYKNKKHNNYLIAGEMTSQFHSGWIEGALESVDNIIKYFII